MFRVYCSDCLRKLPEISTRKEDTVIVTSPPYNLNLRIRSNSNKYKSREVEKGISEQILRKYENYKDDLPMNIYYEFQRQFLEIALQKAHLVFYNIQMVTGNKVALFDLIGHFSTNIKEVIIWDKINSQPAVKDGCLNSRYEFIFVLSEDGMRRRFAGAPFGRGLDNLWQIKAGRHKGCRAGFPEELVERIINSFVHKGSLIIDPFLGGGTTGVVCKRLGYDFIGIELDRNTYEYAIQRIKEEPLTQYTDNSIIKS